MSVPRRPSNDAPPNYVVPDFPSLYWPFQPGSGRAQYLYRVADIWRFTLLWTLIFYAAVHLATSLYAIGIQWRRSKVVWIVPLVYMAVAALEALIAGSAVGGVVGGVYDAAYFRMSTWIPFVWAVTNTLILILSSFAMQGGM